VKGVQRLLLGKVINNELEKRDNVFDLIDQIVISATKRDIFQYNLFK